MFDEKVLEELGLENLSGEQRTTALESLNANLANRVTMQLTAQLDEDGLAEFEKVLEAEGDATAQKWLREKVPDQQRYIDEAKLEIITEVKKLSETSLQQAAEESL